jgi:hypothetical protein
MATWGRKPVVVDGNGFGNKTLGIRRDGVGNPGDQGTTKHC